MGGRTVNYRIKEEMRKNIARIYPEKETRRRKKKGEERRRRIYEQKQRKRVGI